MRRMTIREAATALGVAPATLRVQVYKGKLKAEKRGRDLWIAPAEVERYRNRHLKAVLEQRFRRRLVVMPSGCWEWQGRRDRFGYGLIQEGSRGDVHVYRTHRLAYETFVGPIAEGLSVLHRCDNPPCVNPEHLFVGTRQDNVTDMIAKGRQATAPRLVECKRGHQLVGDNVYVRPDNGKRSCRACIILRGQARRAGHADLDTTRRYVGKTPGAMDEAKRRLHEVMG